MPSPTSKTKPKPSAAQPGEALQPLYQWQFAAIGTRWWVGIYQPVSGAAFAALQTAVIELCEQFDARYSRFRPDSLVSKWARQAGSYALPPDAKPLLDMYAKLYQITGGAVTPLVGQLLSDAGYDASYSLVPKPSLRRPPSWEETLSYNDTTITMHQAALLDMGAAGKGYLVDQICELLQGRGITKYLVDGSGDMRCNFDASAADTAQAGQPPLLIGLENPNDTQQVLGVANLRGGALCGSAGNRRAWGGKLGAAGKGKPLYTHIMNPFTRQSQTNYQAVWVAAETALLADGLTTALYFAEPAELQKHFNFEYALVAAGGGLETSAHFPAEFFTKPHAAESTAA